MGKPKDITGLKFGKLTAIKLDHIVCQYTPKGGIKRSKHYWLCICDCGNKIIARKDFLGVKIFSCGCYRNELNHGLRDTRIYSIWKGMKQRCYNVHSPKYKVYGQRNIEICKEWKNNFSNFYNWSINNGYKDNLSIDRINVNGNYCPENCRWIPLKQQARNKQASIFIKYNQQEKTLAEWCEILKLKYIKTYKRIYLYHWSIEKAFNTP